VRQLLMQYLISGMMMSIHLLRRPLPLIFRCNKWTPIRWLSEKADAKLQQQKEEDEEPVKFSESDAYLKWKVSV
jgi:hypothetical protein